MHDGVVGQRVEFIGLPLACNRGYGWEQVPVKGRVYRIRAVRDHFSSVGFLLDGVVNPPAQYNCGFCEADFRSTLFRPVVEAEAEADISELQAALDAVNNGEVIDA